MLGKRAIPPRMTKVQERTEQKAMKRRSVRTDILHTRLSRQMKRVKTAENNLRNAK